jgi:hypothetical protein
MNQAKKRIATKTLLLAAMLCAGSMAWAGQVVGSVGHLSGALLLTKADGTVRILARKSTFEQGDTLLTEKNTYAQLRFADNTEVTLKPGTTFTIDKFAFDAGKPEADSAVFSLDKGGLRLKSGLLGKGSRERFSLVTPTATITIHEATFVAEVMAPGPVALAAMRVYLLASTAGLGIDPPLVPLQLAQLTAPKPPAAGLPPGLYVSVIDGAINLSNKGGTTNFTAGQFGYTANVTRPPVVVPANPGIQFTPPPAFSAPPSAPPTSGSNKAAAIDCVVR